MIKITIITTTFNSAATLRDTFESILRQTYNNWECVIVDGDSKDGTLQIIKEYEPRFNGRLRVLSEPDTGLYDAMNKGIGIATGDVIGFLNSDDFYTDETILDIVAKNLSDDHIDAIYGDIHYVRSGCLDKCVRYYSSRVFRPWMMRYGFMPAHPSFYVKSGIYRKLGLYNTTDFKVAADFECLLRFIYLGHIRTRYVNKDFVTMRTGGMSSSGVKSKKLIMKDHLRALRAHKVYSNVFMLSLRYIYKVFELLSSKALFVYNKKAQK